MPQNAKNGFARYVPHPQLCVCPSPWQEARMDALSVLTNDRVFVNPVDRLALLRMLSGMNSLRSPLSRSPLYDPKVVRTSHSRHAERSAAAGSIISILKNASSNDGGKVSASGNDTFMDMKLSRTVSFAHKTCPAATARLLKPETPIMRQIAHDARVAQMRESNSQARMLSIYPRLHHAHELHQAARTTGA